MTLGKLSVNLLFPHLQKGRTYNNISGVPGKQKNYTIPPMEHLELCLADTNKVLCDLKKINKSSSMLVFHNSVDILSTTEEYTKKWLSWLGGGGACL